MHVPINKLPDSRSEIWSITLVGLLAILTAAGRMLIAKGELSWRRLIGGLIIAFATAIAVYSILVFKSEAPISGYFGLTVGCVCGYFTEHILKLVPSLIDTFAGRKAKGGNNG